MTNKDEVIFGLSRTSVEVDMTLMKERLLTYLFPLLRDSMFWHVVAKNYLHCKLFLSFFQYFHHYISKDLIIFVKKIFILITLIFPIVHV